MKNEVKQKDLFELLVAPVISDPLVQSKPVYYSHLIIQKDKLEQFRDISSLQHKSFAYNGKDSFSGWGAMQKYLYEQKNEWSSLPNTVDVHTVMESFFSSLVLSGSHRNSLQLVSNGTVDCCIVDIMVYNGLRSSNSPQDQELLSQVAVIPSVVLGPSPIQPFVISMSLSAEYREKIRQLMLHAGNNKQGREMLSLLTASHFVRVDERDYESIFKWFSFLKNMP